MAKCIRCGRAAGPQRDFCADCDEAILREAVAATASDTKPGGGSATDAGAASFGKGWRARERASGEAASSEGRANAPSLQSVQVVDIKMSFGSMVVFMVKWSLASIPAMIILILIFALIALLLSTLFGGFVSTLIDR
ncbi:MAG: hypothetical protein JNL26_18120 [Gemmatimonadetes bacterium]|nr:hypothetical protein [Gemmatimonadota bacterium]